MVTSSGYLTRPSRTRGRHRKQRLLLHRRLALGGWAVLLAALVVAAGVVVQWTAQAPVVSLPNTTPVIPSAPVGRAGPAAVVGRAGPPAVVDRAGPPAVVGRAGPPAVVGRAGPPAVVGRAGPPAVPVPFPIDDRGFVNSGARCDGTQTAVATGRTLGSLVVICADGDGRFGYLGVRLRDDALLRTSARVMPAHEFVAQNAGATYAISPAGLVVTAGGAVIKREPMIDYRQRDPNRP